MEVKEEKFTRIFFSNISSWGPKAVRFLGENRRQFQVIALTETHVTAGKYSSLKDTFAAHGRRCFPAHAILTNRSEHGSSGGSMVCPQLSLQFSPMENFAKHTWKFRGDDWSMIIVRAKHVSYIVVMAYFDHTIGPVGRNLLKLQQIQRCLLYFKLPFVLFADWNMPPEVVQQTGFPESVLRR